MTRSILTKAATAVGIVLSLAAIDARPAQSVAISPVFTGSGINNLNIGGTIYNVTFNAGSYQSIFISPDPDLTPTFLNNQGGAGIAAGEIRSFCAGNTACTNNTSYILVPFQFAGGMVTSVRRDIMGGGALNNFQLNQTTTPATGVGSKAFYATFTTASVPTESVPEPLTILGSAAAVGFGAAMKRVADKKKSAC